LAAESWVTPGACSRTLSRLALSPWGIASIFWRSKTYGTVPIGGTILRRASSSTWVRSATTCASLGGGGAGSRGAATTGRGFGRRWTGGASLGGLTLISGRVVVGV